MRQAARSLALPTPHPQRLVSHAKYPSVLIYDGRVGNTDDEPILSFTERDTTSFPPNLLRHLSVLRLLFPISDPKLFKEDVSSIEYRASIAVKCTRIVLVHEMVQTTRPDSFAARVLGADGAQEGCLCHSILLENPADFATDLVTAVEDLAYLHTRTQSTIQASPP